MSRQDSVEKILKALRAADAPINAGALAETTGLTKAQAYWSIKKLLVDGVIEQKGTVRVEGVCQPVKLFALKKDATGVTSGKGRRNLGEVLSRAKELGGVFGILVAQVEAA